MSRKMSVKNQDIKIAAEVKRLNEIFSGISEDKKEGAKELINRVAFMTITLELLEYEIKAKGPVYNFEQGKQKMLVENPAQKSYNAMMNRYTPAYDKLLSLLPKEIGQMPSDRGDDGFDDFVGGRGD